MNNSKSSQPTWQLDHTNPHLANILRQSLREVTDPELGMNVIQLGLIRDAFIENDNLKINMILTTPYCPYAPTMLEMTRIKAETSLNMTTTVDLQMEVWDFSMMEEGAAPDWGLY